MSSQYTPSPVWLSSYVEWIFFDDWYIFSIIFNASCCTVSISCSCSAFLICLLDGRSKFTNFNNCLLDLVHADLAFAFSFFKIIQISLSFLFMFWIILWSVLLISFIYSSVISLSSSGEVKLCFFFWTFIYFQLL